MAPGLDQVAGWGMVSFAGFVFVYYSIWVIVLPFVEPHQSIHHFFLPRVYAIAGPLIAGVIALALIESWQSYHLELIAKEIPSGAFYSFMECVFVLHVMISSKKSKKS